MFSFTADTEKVSKEKKVCEGLSRTMIFLSSNELGFDGQMKIQCCSLVIT